MDNQNEYDKKINVIKKLINIKYPINTFIFEDYNSVFNTK